MQLRDYQQEMKDRLYEAWTEHQSVMVQMPTGTGKTYLMAKVIEEQAGGGVLIVAHRIELIAQIAETLDGFGVPHGIIDRTTADIGDVTGRHEVVVASIQTLARRMGHRTDTDGMRSRRNTGWRPGTIIIDEAHHAVAKTYRWLWEAWPEARFFGLTATPCRLDDTGFKDLFDTLLQSYSIQEFIDRGWLSDFEYISVTPDNDMVERIAGLKKRGVDGDYQTKEMATVMDSQESIAHLYLSYEQYAKGKKGIVYAISREHAQHIAAYYAGMGVRCAVIDATTPADERRRIVEAYRNRVMPGRTDGRPEGTPDHDDPGIDVMVNVDIFSEGFDCPEVEFIQLARPTLSLSKYLQQVGRGMRITSKKDYVIILDQVGMYQTFGMPTVERDWSMMFLGKENGRGQHGGDRRFVIREEQEQTLLNLQMVRIKRYGEKDTGMEVFIQDGKYGVLNDGKVVCQAEFEKVRRLDNPYFAIGIYPYYVYRNRVDIIGMDGRVMRPGIYGNVRQQGDVFIGQDITGRTDYWDAKGGRHYRSMPKFERIQRFEVARIGEQVYMRQYSREWDKPIDIDSIYLHDDFYIFGNMLVFRDDITKAYEVCGYERGCIYIKCGILYDREHPYACITRYGNIMGYEKTLPSRLSRTPPNIGNLGMKRYFRDKELA